jgi:archaellum component FlaF (FlaF/FlaG flagellin family)
VDKIITTTLLIIAGIVCTMLVFNTAYPMVSRSTQAMVSTAEKIDDRMESRINIVHAADTSNRQTVYIWVKNVGSSRIVSVEESDVFFGQEDDFSRIPYKDDAGEAYPRWEYVLENNTEWVSGATLKITITYDADPGAGTYYIKIVIPNGVMDEYYFSM